MQDASIANQLHLCPRLPRCSYNDLLSHNYIRVCASVGVFVCVSMCATMRASVCVVLDIDDDVNNVFNFVESLF